MTRLLPWLVWILSAVVLTPSAASAQNRALNGAKYGALRERLLAQWLILGTDQGMSMPAHIRNEDRAFIRWADATIDLGWYIGILGTEYALSTDARFDALDGVLGGFDTTDELALALLALERLDRVADASFAPECPGEPDLNGFFIRDDVPGDFHTNFAGMTSTRSDFIDGPTLKEMSQDQVYHLLLGLGLVRRFVPRGVVARGRDLHELATELAVRIIRKMDDDNWVIQNPVCDRDVDRGHSARAYSPGTARVAAWFTDGAYFPETDDVAAGIWELGRDVDAAFYSDPDNLHMVMAIAAVGRGFDDDTAAVLANLSTRHDWAVYPLAYGAMHDDPRFCDDRETLFSAARVMLDELPVGEFPGSPRPGGPAVHGFTVSNRFIRDSAEHYVGPAGSDGEHNHGLDYMLLHNVAALAAPDLWADAPEPCVAPAEDMGAEPNDDAGTSPGGDAGSVSGGDSGGTGNGPASTEPAGGCGCATNGSAPHVLLMVFFVGILARRRGRRGGAI